MNKKLAAAIAALLVALAAGGYFWQSSRPAAVPAPPPLAVSAPAPQPPPAPPKVEPPIRYPLAASGAALPDLERSDAPLFKALADGLGKRVLGPIFGDEVIRRIVKTVDNLPRASLPPDAVLFKPVPGAFATAGQGDALVIGRRNAARYAPYVAIARRIDAAKLAGIYVDFYPLFQRAYEELVNSRAYFNDRLVEAIDDLLAAPEPAGAVRLVRTNGNYQFAGADLAARSAGQGILIRMGGAHAALVKAKLREIRAEITRGAAPQPAPGGSAAGEAAPR